MPKVIVSIDGVVIKEVTLAKDHTSLGRRPYNDIVIDNLAVSGEHAVLHLIGTDVYLEDLNSTNGTYVNARAIKKQALEHNDLIEVGKFKLRYVVGSAASDTGLAKTPLLPPDSMTIPLMSVPTALAPLSGLVGAAVIRVLSGAGAGQELPLQKVVTTIGKPGVAVAAITRRIRGYVVTPIDAGTLLNGEPLGADAVSLQDGDVLELGGMRMQFTHV